MRLLAPPRILLPLLNLLATFCCCSARHAGDRHCAASSAATAWSIDVDVVVGPVDVAAPIASAAGPTPNRVTRAERQASREKCAAARPVAGSPVIRRICRVGPRAIDHSRIVVRHIDRFRIRRLNDDDLLAALGFLRNLLLFRRLELVVGVGLGAQPLDTRPSHRSAAPARRRRVSGSSRACHSSCRVLTASPRATRTLSSQPCLSTAAFSASSLRPLFSFSQRLACTTSSG